MSGRPVGIESIVASHLEVFIRTVSDDFLDESLNSLSDIDSFVNPHDDYRTNESFWSCRYILQFCFLP